MSETPLATPAEAARLGHGTVSEQALAKASARARGFTKQTISRSVSTVLARGPRVTLPQRPVQAVTRVTDTEGHPVTYQLQPGGVLKLGTSGLVNITYQHGFSPVPDHVLETVCTIAARLESLAPGLTAGVQQESGGSESATFGWDSFQGVGGLVTSEKEALARLFPSRGGLIVQRS